MPPQPYAVALLEAADIPSSERIAAETRYAREIERALGAPEEVARVYRAWVSAMENDVAMLDSQTALLASRWPKAADAAQRAGMRNLGDLGEAHFELRVPRHNAPA